MTEKTVTIFDGFDFGMTHCIDKIADNNDFCLHEHSDVFEIVLFISGDADFHVEGNVYPLEPYDLIITRPCEMHRIYCKSAKQYERIITYLTADYFEKHNLQQLSEIFCDRPLGTGNLIPSEFVKSDLLDSLNRVHTYSKQKEYIPASGAIIEFLYLLNKSKKAAVDAAPRDKRVADVIKFINENLSEVITLDMLAEKFFIDKYHLCRVFKKSTGYTVNAYINYKRLLFARELHMSGQSLLEASANAGFNNYSNFYRMYVRQNGGAPKNMI